MTHLYWPGSISGRLVALLMYGAAVAAAFALAGYVSGLASHNLIRPFTVLIASNFGEVGLQITASVFVTAMIVLFIRGRFSRWSS